MPRTTVKQSRKRQCYHRWQLIGANCIIYLWHPKLKRKTKKKHLKTDKKVIIKRALINKRKKEKIETKKDSKVRTINKNITLNQNQRRRANRNLKRHSMMMPFYRLASLDPNQKQHKTSLETLKRGKVRREEVVISSNKTGRAKTFSVTTKTSLNQTLTFEATKAVIISSLTKHIKVMQ